VLLAAIVLAGCGSGKLHPRGRVLKDGAPFLPEKGADLVIFFVPVVGEGQKHPGDVYAARSNEADGTFQVTGKDEKGLPPGRYKITIEHMSKKRDLLAGAFSEDKTPFVRDIDARTGEIVLDVGKP
jgi:hypothetical protein